MSCPTGQIIQACDFPQFFVDETPRFDEMIMEDIRPTDGWIGNVATGTTPMGTPVEITQDRFRSVFPNTTKTWSRVTASSPGCAGSYCDPTENQIGWGADRLTYYAEQQVWATPMLCYDQDMHVTHAVQHLNQIVSEILRPAMTSISSNFLRKRALLWSKYKHMANGLLSSFTYQWVLGGTAGDEEIYFDSNAAPTNLFHLVPQMLQNNFSKTMREGYAGKNPFKDTSPFIELVSDMDTIWFLDKLGSNGASSGANQINTSSNWRFTEWSAANAFWRYGYSGQIGNYMARMDEMGLRFNYVSDRGAGANGGNGNRYRYQVVLPYTNGVTTGAGGAAGIGSNVNPDFDRAQFAISFQWHKEAMELLVPDATPLNPEMPFTHRDFGGKWQFQMHDLGADASGNPISNAWGNKGRFAAWFKYYVRPKHYEFARSYFHKREQFCIPQIDVCSASPGYPAQRYTSSLPACPAPAGTYGTGVPTGSQDGPLP
jgi:hypothetical protein